MITGTASMIQVTYFIFLVLFLTKCMRMGLCIGGAEFGGLEGTKSILAFVLQKGNDAGGHPDTFGGLYLICCSI